MRTTDILKKHGIRPRKRFGQNFLVDDHVLEKIIASAEITEADLVIEIGPGIGALTRYLCEAAAAVRAIEIDRDLVETLGETLADFDNVRVISGDVMKADLAEIIAEGRNAAASVAGIDPEAVDVRVVANLPYYITTPILMKLLEEELPVRSITVMIQKEVADRMRAEAGTSDYGALSLAVRYYAEPEIAAIVPPNCFIPRPKVDSAVVHLRRKNPEERVPVQDPALMFRLIRAAFSQRRKTLANALKNAQELSFSREEVEAAILACGLSPTVRGEALSLEHFAALADAFV